MDVLGYGGLFLSMGVTIGQLLKNHGQLNSKYLRLKQLQVSTPQSLIQEIEKELSQNHSLNNLSFIRQNQVFIEGVISSNHPVKSVLIEGLEILYSLFYNKDLYSKKQFSNNVLLPALLPTNEKKFIKIASNLFLKDYESQQVCDIIKRSNTNVTAALDLLSMKAHFIERGILSNLFKSIVQFIKLLLNITYLKLNFLRRKNIILYEREIKKKYWAKTKFENILYFVLLLMMLLIKQGAYEGNMDIEMGLKMNSLITIFGDIIYDVRNKKLVMENPMYILKDKQQLLKVIQKKLMKKRIFILILSIPFLIGGFMFIKKLIDIIKKYIQNQRDKLITHLRSKMDVLAQDKNIGDNQKCNICYSNLRNIILKPCLHMCLCHHCLKRIRKQECPICKADILSYIELFLK